MKYEVRFIDGYTMKYTIMTIDAQSKEEAVDKVFTARGADFEHQLTGVQEVGISNTEKYTELQKLQSECEYYLNVRTGLPKTQWGKKVENSIKKMREIYNSLSYNDRPYWLSLANIDSYARAYETV